MEEADLKNYLLNALIAYLKAKAEPYIEKGIGKVSYILGFILSALMLFFTLIMFTVFAGIALAMVFSSITGKDYYGFLIVAGIYLFSGWLVWIFRSRLIGWLIARLMIREVKKVMTGE